ncbi:MAG: VWA-like domain-containing protein [Lachnospiraceae bacterium]|nr:VWA-like domain-containing protein [Lachnospiraceae bacterium]
MVLSEEKLKEYMKRLLLARMRILCNNGFYGLLLMHTTYTIDAGCVTAATDGTRIFFGPDFLENLSDRELDFVLMHEILHVVLKHCIRGLDKDNERFNIAADIVVNSNIIESLGGMNSITDFHRLGEPMHVTPKGDEGYEFTAEEVYAMLPAAMSDSNDGRSGAAGKGKFDGSGGGKGFRDDHSRWPGEEDGNLLENLWVKRFEDACEAIAIRDPDNKRGMLPVFAERLLRELMKPQTDWRTILNEFIQEEVTDYSFNPPDRRFDDSPFFLPDFNDKESVMKNILFMIDTSGSMSDEMVTAAFSEVKGAIDQYDGKLQGWLGFFDAAVIEPTPFSNIEEFEIIRPAGGGGTDFGIIFKYVEEYMSDELPVSIIILTDGIAPFPPAAASMGIPVIWLLNNTEVNPPWGKVARITV